jgi:hypothetical protein
MSLLRPYKRGSTKINPSLFLDVRPQQQREEWHIPESVHRDAYAPLNSGDNSVLDDIQIVPFLLGQGPSWDWIIMANVLLGISQGLAWFMTMNMKIDLVGPSKRGLAMGLNEVAGYGAVGLTALITGYMASSYGLSHPTCICQRRMALFFW